MACIDMNKVNGEDMWFLDSGCSNHMCGKKEYFWILMKVSEFL